MRKISAVWSILQVMCSIGCSGGIMFSPWQTHRGVCPINNNNSNSKTMFMVLSSWQSHCESSPSEFDQCKTAPSGRQSKTKPDNLGCESACTGARVYTQHRHPIVLCQHWLVHTVGTGRADESITQAAAEAWLRVVFSSLLRCFCTTCSGD